MTASLHGRAALITGGGSGVGRGTALALADRGAAVAILGRTMEQCEQTVHDIENRGGTAIALGCDVTKADDIDRAVAAVSGSWGRIDIVVHSAQSFNYGPIRKLSAEDLDESWRTGPLAAFLLMRSALPALRSSRGLIVNIASGVGVTAPPAMAAYAMAKEALRTLTRVAAVEWGPYGIRAVALCPFAATPGLDNFDTTFGLSSERDLVPQIPLRRLGDPEHDVGRVVAFLASEDASYITGTTLMVDGGYSYLR
ncbi:SDR family NAD(P)-dependent oxidoreductase [uncultured Mycobacterium sp.]|uniref:SDR family NAD(P)-dependent oxidoreductase n=1 Tax=uncultured Mycobacterium sp. TaxID=171292 RepID=UPI0035CC62FA